MIIKALAHWSMRSWDAGVMLNDNMLYIDDIAIPMTYRHNDKSSTYEKMKPIMRRFALSIRDLEIVNFERRELSDMMADCLMADNKEISIEYVFRKYWQRSYGMSAAQQEAAELGFFINQGKCSIYIRTLGNVYKIEKRYYGI